jgi:Tol biopolymer transport system component
MRGAGNRVPLRLFGRGTIVKTFRLNQLRAALLAVAAAGLLAAVGLFMVVLYAQPAEANYPGKPGKIAFSQDDGNDFEIYTINPNGGGKKQLTDNSLDDRSPAYSPSDKKIVYQGRDAPNGDPEIYTINVGGGGKQPVTDNSSDDYSPDYAPTGKRIAYTNYAGTGTDEEIYTINPGGGGRTPVTDNSSDDRSPSYSPSGKKIAFQGYDGTDNEIYTINPGGGGRTPVTDNGTRDFEPYWGSQ